MKKYAVIAECNLPFNGRRGPATERKTAFYVSASNETEALEVAKSDKYARHFGFHVGKFDFDTIKVELAREEPDAQVDLKDWLE